MSSAKNIGFNVLTLHWYIHWCSVIWYKAQCHTWHNCMWWRLTHWGRVTHICVSKLNIIGSENGLSPGRRQAIIWTSAGILLIGPLGTNFNETSIEIHTFSFKKIHLKLSSGKWRPSCLGLNVLRPLDSFISTPVYSSVAFIMCTSCAQYEWRSPCDKVCK